MPLVTLEVVRDSTLQGRTLELCSRGLPWVRKGSLAMLDQGLISGSNFLVTVLLARWLAPEQYGAYALAFSIFLLLVRVHDSLVSEPMTVFGPSSYADHRREYLGAVLKIEAVLGLALAAVLGLSAAVAHYLAAPAGLASALAGLSISTPCVLLLWVARYAFYVEQSPGSAASGAALYTVLVVSGTFVVFRHGWLSPFTAFMVTALGALVSSISMWIRLRPVLKRGSSPTPSNVWSLHWHYGRWVLGTSAVKWVPGNVSYVLTGSLLGMADVGALRALLNLSLPLLQAANSLSNLFQPYLARIHGKQGRAAIMGPVNLVTLLYLVGGVAYWALFTAFKVPILRFLYGGKFMEHASLVPWVTLGAVCMVGSYGGAIGLRAIQSPASVFLAYATAGVVSIGLGLVATWAFGLSGAIGGYVLSGMTVLSVTTYLFRRNVNPPPEISDHPSHKASVVTRKSVESSSND
jgi:O-antigen/teichoic acid export membrane protein